MSTYNVCFPGEIKKINTSTCTVLLNSSNAEKIKMPRPLLNSSQSDYLILMLKKLRCHAHF